MYFDNVISSFMDHNLDPDQKKCAIAFPFIVIKDF